MGGPRTVRYRRSPHLVSYWSGKDLIIHNYATRTRVGGHPIVCEILHFFDDWRPAAELFAAKPHVGRRALQQLLSLLVKRSLLQDGGRSVLASEREMDGWADWNPAAGFFHNSTKDLRFADLDTMERLEREKARVSRMPDPVKRYPRARVSRLPAIRTTGQFADVLLARRTWRRFARRPIDLAAFSTLVGLTGGIQSWLIASNDQKVAVKTSPSGGARHPIELYALVLKVDGLRRGLYHYAADNHALELIEPGGSSRIVERYLPNQWWFKGASAVVFFAAVFPREQWRYTHPRAYRAVLIEAGHLCQTFCLTATWLGLAPFCTMALADSRIENDLKLDGITESVLYAAGVGTRPEGVEWTPPNTIGEKPATLTRRGAQKFPGRPIRPRR